MSPAAVRVGMLGCGTVGSAVVRLLQERSDDIDRRSALRFEITRVAVRDVDRDRGTGLPEDVFTADAEAVAVGSDVDVVCEVMGGVEPALSLVLAALARRKPVVSANKELLAAHGAEVFARAAQAGVDVAFEAAVAGGIPVIRALKESLAGERVTRLTGIVNGTTNFILTRMADDEIPFDDALAEAQRLGYAEADPAADVEGFDAAAKCAILASIAFNTGVVASDVFREGIGSVGIEDIRNAKRLGYVIKPVAFAELEEEDVAVRVHPAMIPVDHPLASVRGANNAVFVEGPRIGELMFYGAGAGGDPTATAVVGDLIAVSRNLITGGRALGAGQYLERTVRSMDDMESAYYLLLDVADRPGVLAQVASAFGDNDVSIKSVWQEGTGEEAQLVLITHRAREGALQATVGSLGALEPVSKVRSVLRVEGEE